MDYQGNYFKDDDIDENESKIHKTVRLIFKYILYGFSLIVWVLIIYFLIVNRDRDIVTENYMHELETLQNVDTDKITLTRINPREFMNYDGSVQVYNVDYSDEFGLLELGVKYNVNKVGVQLSDGTFKTLEPEFVLTDSDGTRYNIAYTKNESGGRYAFYRICFEGICIDLESNDLKFEAAKEADPEFRRTSKAYYLYIYDKNDPRGENREEIEKFLIYNNNAVVYPTDYDKG